MKIITVQFDDAVDISTVAVGASATVSGVASAGTVMLVGQMANPPAQTLIPHVHDVPGGSGSVIVPPSTTGPATP
jgi:hypothetical protein